MLTEASRGFPQYLHANSGTTTGYSQTLCNSSYHPAEGKAALPYVRLVKHVFSTSALEALTPGRFTLQANTIHEADARQRQIRRRDASCHVLREWAN
jgi:hypothetical protein